MVTVLKGRPPLSRDKLESIAELSKEHAMLHGLLLRTRDNPGSSDRVECFPMTLFPSVVPRALLNHVRNIQPHFSRLMHKVAHDKEFLYKCFKNVLKHDDFTFQLWNIFCTVCEEGPAQPVSLGLFRNDYMMQTKNEHNIQMKQIEFNMIACARAALISRLHHTHRYSLTQAGKQYDVSQLPGTDSIQAYAGGLIRAWQIYDKESAVVLFVVAEEERNHLDQRLLDIKLFEMNPKTKVLYRTFHNLAAGLQLSDEKVLKIDGHEVAVVYFRTCYSPTHYRGEKDWRVRLLIERSKAIKCPPVQYQLAGAKRVQMELCRPGAIEKYIDDRAISNRIRATFVEQLSLNPGRDGDCAVNKALENPDGYVMKPNREGGGNNIYGARIPKVLEQIKDSPERSQYILMERIRPRSQKNVLLQPGQAIAVTDVISEIGIYAVYIGTECDEIENFEAGYLIRTKEQGTNEGKSVSGCSCLDTPYFLD